MEQTAPFNKFAIPMRMALILVLIKVIVSTIGYMFFAGSWGMTMFFGLLAFAAGIFLLVQTGKMQRKAMGGFISLGDAFVAIFLAAAIASIISGIYDMVYIKWIDPNMMEKIKESSIATAEKWGAPQETLDDIEKKFDEQSSDKMNIVKQLTGFIWNLLFSAVVSIIIAAIIKKNKPLEMTQPNTNE